MDWLSILTHGAAALIGGGLCFYFGMRYHGIDCKPQNGPVFVQCPHCERNKYPVEEVCPHCGYVECDRVVCWVFTGPACQRVFVYKDGNTLRPMVEGLARGTHPSVGAQHIFEYMHGVATLPEQWRTVAVVDNKDKNKGRTAYMICIMPSDNGKGGIIVDRVQFSDQQDNAVLRLTTRALKFDEETELKVVG